MVLTVAPTCWPVVEVTNPPPPRTFCAATHGGHCLAVEFFGDGQIFDHEVRVHD
jgi:hypothetical protein